MAISDEEHLRRIKYAQDLANMNAIINPPLITGAVSNNSVAIANAWQNQQVATFRMDSMFDPAKQVRTNIVRADNGYILMVYPADNAIVPRVLVASSIEELRDLITCELVTSKMEK